MNRRSAFRTNLIEWVKARPGLRASDYVILLWKNDKIDKSPNTILLALLDLEKKGVVVKERESGWYSSRTTPYNWRICEKEA